MEFRPIKCQHFLPFLGKISDVLSFGGGQAVPESWSVYRMVHLADHEGIVLDASRQNRMYDKAGELLWGWIFLYKNLPKVRL